MADHQSVHSSVQGKEYTAGSYEEAERRSGDGPKRTGSSLLLNEDIYSLFFLSTFHPDILFFADNYLKGKHEV